MIHRTQSIGNHLQLDRIAMMRSTRLLFGSFVFSVPCLLCILIAYVTNSVANVSAELLSLLLLNDFWLWLVDFFALLSFVVLFPSLVYVLLNHCWASVSPSSSVSLNLSSPPHSPQSLLLILSSSSSASFILLLFSFFLLFTYFSDNSSSPLLLLLLSHPLLSSYILCSLLLSFSFFSSFSGEIVSWNGGSYWNYPAYIA